MQIAEEAFLKKKQKSRKIRETSFTFETYFISTIISSGAREAEGRPSEANLKIFFVINVFSVNFGNRKICIKLLQDDNW